MISEDVGHTFLLGRHRDSQLRVPATRGIAEIWCIGRVIGLLYLPIIEPSCEVRPVSLSTIISLRLVPTERKFTQMTNVL
jgi:hypothetical protein